MKTKMKLLSLALLGLGGLAFASVSAAACPDGPTAADGGAWYAASEVSGSLEINSPGLDASDCRLDAKITGDLGFASAFVHDNSPANEERYRAQFIFDPTDVGAVTISESVRLFSATTENPAQSVPEVIQLTYFGNVSGTQAVLGISTACASASNGRCGTSIPLDGTSPYRVELDWQKGASGVLNIWVNNNDSSAPDATVSIDNSGWGGVDNAYLGLAIASEGFRGTHLNQVVSFDTFDSRRSTFIGF